MSTRFGRAEPNGRCFTRRLGLFGIALSAALLLVSLAPRGVLAESPSVRIIHLEGEINAVIAGYVSAAVAKAASEHAGGLVIVTNTPGGVSTSMDEIVTTLLNAPVPVAVYVAPAGARATSAGLFVAQAADVVAMAPGTKIGSACPVTGSGGDIGGDLGRKVLNDAVARIRNLATPHHRNADWCEEAVRNSVNIGADQAIKMGVADLEPATLSALLDSLDRGRVFVAGATWPAVSASGPIGSGETIRMLAQDGGALQVEAAARSAPGPRTTSQPTVPRSPEGDGAEPPDL